MTKRNLFPDESISINSKIALLFVASVIFSIIIIQDASAQSELTMKPGETQTTVIKCGHSWGSEPLNCWADAAGETASWISPQHTDFGTIWPGDPSVERTVTVTVPSNQEPGYYELRWIYGCSSSLPCESAPDKIIPVTVTGEETIEEEKQILVPPNDFEFDIETPAFATVNQGDTVSVTVIISYIRGEREQVALSATSWSNLGITTWFDDNPVLPSQTTSFFIKTTCGTTPDNYYFDVLGTSESAATSIDSVTVTVNQNSACGNVQTSKTTKYLPYENNQYGFSLKYPSTWQKDEILEIDDDKPNRVTIATFTSPSQTGFYMVGFAENDPTYKGLDDQQFLNKMKKEISNECQECQDTEFLSADTVTHKNGYKVHYAVLTTTIPSDDGTLNPLLTYALIPDGNDLWLIALMLFSSDDSEQLLDEITPMGESFTIFDYEGTRQTSSDDLDELNQKGNDLFDLERYDEAIPYYDQVLEIDPDDVVALTNKGLALRNLERHEEAISYYDRVLEIDPNDALVLNNKGAALYNLDRNKEALEYYDMALEIDPNYVSPLYNKGHLLNDLERYRDAIPYFDRVLTIDPEDVDALDEKGYALASLGSHKEALEYYDMALAIAPNDISTLFDKGFSLVDLERYDEGISYYDLVLEQDPKDVITLNNKGYALLQLGKNDEALVYFNKALDIDPNYELAQENKDIALEALSGKKPEEGGCLIATATFGSELAPQVQFLREIRDNAVLSTASGTSFMSTFNAFYYSFSPTVADLERQNPVFKETVKVTITPLLSSLSLLQYVDIDSESEMLGYGISIILLNVGMYFVVPALIIFKIRNRK